MILVIYIVEHVILLFSLVSIGVASRKQNLYENSIVVSVAKALSPWLRHDGNIHLMNELRIFHMNFDVNVFIVYTENRVPYWTCALRCNSINCINGNRSHEWLGSVFSNFDRLDNGIVIIICSLDSREWSEQLVSVIFRCFDCANFVHHKNIGPTIITLWLCCGLWFWHFAGTYTYTMASGDLSDVRVCLNCQWAASVFVRRLHRANWLRP